MKQNACFTLESRAPGAATTSHFKAQAALLADGQAGGAGTAPLAPAPSLSSAARAGLLGAAPPLLDRIRCPSCFFLHGLYRNQLSLDVWSEGGLSRRSYGREELRRCGAVPAKTLTYILGAKAAFPFRRRAVPGSRAGVATGPAGPAPDWPCLSGGEADPSTARLPGRARVGRPRGAEARASRGRAPSGPGRRRVCPRNPALKPGFAPRLLFNTSQKMRLFPAGPWRRAFPAFGRTGSDAPRTRARAYYPRFKSRALIVENVQLEIFF